MRLIEAAPHSRYITINQGHIFIPNDIADRSIGFSVSIKQAFEELQSKHSKGAKTKGPVKFRHLTPNEQTRQEQLVQQFYPCFMVNHGCMRWEIPPLSIEWSTHYTFKLGLNKAKNEVYNVYPGTFIAIETINKPEADFSLLSTEISSDSSGRIIIPRTD